MGKSVLNSGKGGYLVGRSHAEGGIPVKVKSTGQFVEVEGGEIIINKKSSNDENTLHEFNGQKLTNRQILSQINQMGGGVAFADGGEMPDEIMTNGVEYKYGGKVMKDYDIVTSCGCKHKMKSGGDVEDHAAIYEKWKELVNMPVVELEAFYKSEDGKNAGLSTDEAHRLGIHNGRQSARWIIKMKQTPVDKWTPEMWEWAKSQVSFISRMRGNEGKLYDEDGNKTRKHTSLLIWGHNPENYANGGEMKEPDYDGHYEDIDTNYANGGTIEEIYKFNTPTGLPSKLNYLQQVLVRTKAFKNYFGDWEKAGKGWINDKKNRHVSFSEHYKGVSLVIDWQTLEPKVLYHGTCAAAEFDQFDVTNEIAKGRPYGYFAENREYAENFTNFSQTGQGKKCLVYTTFLNIKKPFIALGDGYDHVRNYVGYWLKTIKQTICFDKYGHTKVTTEISDAVESQIGDYARDVFGSKCKSFWMLMAMDADKQFKYFLMSFGYDGIAYAEEIKSIYNEDDPAEYSKSFTIFNASQVKIADGRNVNFDPFNTSIFLEKGGKIETDMQQETTVTEGYNDLRKMMLGGTMPKSRVNVIEIMRKGGSISDKLDNFEVGKKRMADKEYVENLIKRTKAHNP